MQVVAVGVSSASSARNPCRPASCLHADLQSTYSRTAVHCRLQLFEPRFFQSLAAIVSEERIRQVQKRSSIKEKSHQVSHLALLLSESIVVLHRSQKFSLTTFELQPPPGYNATFGETLLGRHHGREKGSSPSTV